ncbi:hypothetical protein [Inquilinus limosus]|uniref:Uncharacterized protein n=1 Tax=Inquilinus limosus MP06 TaxID=1398085 RepID=A0A0A0DDJ4_9PROT|nr:hypothetical protein [Inquilinus limosus]KGM36115.1 hypothetical protein P409_00255 [Inquilinus limosus MP06]
MSTTYFECHVTMVGDPAQLRPMVEEVGWKFSQIDGDPVLGEEVKCYATMLFNARKDQEWVLNQLLATADALEGYGATVLRRKVERVLYDDRSSAVRFQCNGACPECHLDDYVERRPPPENQHVITGARLPWVDETKIDGVRLG